MWLSQFLLGFKISPDVGSLYRKTAISNGDSTPVLYQDNKSTVSIIEKGRGNFRNTRHIRIRYYFVHDLVVEGIIRVEWVKSEYMVADLLTKGVTSIVFTTLLPKLLGKR